MDAETDSGSISVKDWDRNGLGKRKRRYTSARPLWAWKLRPDVRNFIFLPASISVTEGRLMGGGRHKAGDSEAEGWHRTWHRSSSYGPHSPQMISKVSSEGQDKAIATTLLLPCCEPASQGTAQLLPSKAPPFPAKVTQHSQATSKNPAK